MGMGAGAGAGSGAGAGRGAEISERALSYSSDKLLGNIFIQVAMSLAGPDLFRHTSNFARRDDLTELLCEEFCRQRRSCLVQIDD